MIQAIADFFTAWTMTSGEGRDAKIASAFGDSVYYLDPRTDAPLTDLASLCSYVGEFLPMCPPGASVVVAEPVDENKGHARATVHFVMSPEMRQTGQYFAQLDGDNKITRLIGFVGKGAS